VKVTFRDGEREVPDYLAEMLREVETYRLTYDQAVAAANNKAINDIVGRAVDRQISEHFKNQRTR
jgi:hypothetical protein